MWQRGDILVKPNQKFFIKWMGKIRKYYEDKGYIFTKYKDCFEVKLKDIKRNSIIDVALICDRCGKEYHKGYKFCFNDIKNNHTLCEECKRIEKQEQLYDLANDFCIKHGYQLLTKQEEIIDGRSKIKFICPLHGEHEIGLGSIKLGHKCLRCSSLESVTKRSKKTLHSRIEKRYTKLIEVANQKGYTIITPKEDIIKNTTYIEYKCSNPNHQIHTTMAYNFIEGRGCPECYLEDLKVKYRLSKKEVVERIEKYGGKLLNPDDYINANTKNLKIICKKCGNPFVTSYSSFVYYEGQVCPKCSSSESRGEYTVRMFLESKNIGFIQEKWFPDCRDINPLPFDFYLPDYNACIEFDGSQHHYDKQTFSGGIEYVRKHDKIKNEYCQDKGIRLLRIPY